MDILFFYFYLFIFLLFRATRVAYGSFQTRGQIRAAAASLCQSHQPMPEPPAYAKATAMQDPSCICNLHYSSWQHWIFNPLREARYQTWILVGTSWIVYC